MQRSPQPQPPSDLPLQERQQHPELRPAGRHGNQAVLPPLLRAVQGRQPGGIPQVGSEHLPPCKRQLHPAERAWYCALRAKGQLQPLCHRRRQILHRGVVRHQVERQVVRGLLHQVQRVGLRPHSPFGGWGHLTFSARFTSFYI